MGAEQDRMDYSLPRALCSLLHPHPLVPVCTKKPPPSLS